MRPLTLAWRHAARAPARAVPLPDLVARARRRGDTVFLGWGLHWGPRQAQALAEHLHAAQDAEPRHLMAQVGPAPRVIELPRRELSGNLLVFGTTGAGKTRLFELLAAQCIARGEAVIVIDPKGDRGLCDALRRACVAAGRGNDFLYFHPAFPARSVRLDPLRNWTRVGSIASRIAALLPADHGGAAFVNFGWRALNVVAAALVYVGQRPTLLSLRRYVEGGATPLLRLALQRALGVDASAGEALAQAAPARARAAAGTMDAALAALVGDYEALAARGRRVEEIDGLLSMVRHDQAHYAKMIQHVLPLLASLTHGELGALLSPDPDDLDDPRPLFDAGRVIAAGKVLYVGLDCLSDATTGAAIGSILLADLASVAGDLYNRAGAAAVPVALFVDEVGECANAPLLQLLNKGRAAGFHVTLAAQTWADLVARMGSEARARMIPGNCNALIALRTRDRQTQELVSEAMGDTRLPTLSHSVSQSSGAGAGGISMSGGRGVRIDLRDRPLVPPELLGRLPDHEYFALLRSGTVLKGRLPAGRAPGTAATTA